MRHKEKLAKEVSAFVVDGADLPDSLKDKVRNLIKTAYLTGFNDGSVMQIDYVRGVVHHCQDAGAFMPDMMKKLPITMRRVGENEVVG